MNMKMMKMMMLIMTASSMFSCSVVRPLGEDLTVRQKSQMVFGLAAATSFGVLTQNFDSDDERQKIAINVIKIGSEAFDLLDSGKPIDEVASDALWKRIDVRYAGYLQPAVSMLKAFYTTPTAEDLVGLDNIEYTKAFITGAVMGAQRALEVLNGR